MAADKNIFNQMTQVVIDKLEGGYYHPDMLKDGRVKDSRYSSSGETMFGIDRKAGGSINDTISGKQFWALIDSVNARSKWSWNYKGGEIANQLKKLASDIMYPVYEKLSKLYLSPEAKNIVDSDPRLLFNFIYASWNGSGWFKKFASDINDAVSKGVKNTDELVKIAIDSRTKEGLKKGSPPNSLVAQGGNKIAGFINSLKNKTIEGSKEAIEVVKKNPLRVALITSLITIAIYTFYKKVIKK